MEPQTETQAESSSFRVESSAFARNSSIPQQFTADGDNIAPPLSWSGAPEGTQGFAVIVEDPEAINADARTTTFAHWIVTGIRAGVTSIDGALPDGAVAGTNDYGNLGWNGPNPTTGRHRYFFKVYALDIALDAPGITRPQLLGTMKGHILAQAELIGTYEKPRERSSEKRGTPRRSSSHRPHHPDRH
jgi:Raf kinase inhibitor-like YbhB/YbcL family protein